MIYCFPMYVFLLMHFYGLLRCRKTWQPGRGGGNRRSRQRVSVFYSFWPRPTPVEPMCGHISTASVIDSLAMMRSDPAWALCDPRNGLLIQTRAWITCSQPVGCYMLHNHHPPSPPSAYEHIRQTTNSYIHREHSAKSKPHSLLLKCRPGNVFL